MDGARVASELEVFRQKRSVVVGGPAVGNVQLRPSTLLRVQQPRGKIFSEKVRLVRFCWYLLLQRSIFVERA